MDQLQTACQKQTSAARDGIYKSSNQFFSYRAIYDERVRPTSEWTVSANIWNQTDGNYRG